jgi:hypothetical protein
MAPPSTGCTADKVSRIGCISRGDLDGLKDLIADDHALVVRQVMPSLELQSVRACGADGLDGAAR